MKKCWLIPKDLVGCAAWICCLIGCLIFGSIILTTTGILSASLWIKDECTVLSQVKACMSDPSVICSVNVSLQLNPVSVPAT